MNVDLLKYRFFHRYRLIILLIFFVGLWISWYFMGGIYSITLGFTGQVENVAEAKRMLLNQALTLDMFVSATFTYTMIIMPVLICATSVLFIWEKNGLFSFRFIRKESQKKIVVETIITHGLITGFLFYFCFAIFIIISLIFNKVEMSVARTTFDFLMNSGFSQKYPFYYYMLDGFIKFFVFGVIYSMFASAVSLLTSKTYLSIAVPIIYYFGASVVFASGVQILPLAPVFTQGFSSFVDVPMWSILTPLIIPTIFIIFTIVFTIKRGEKDGR